MEMEIKELFQNGINEKQEQFEKFLNRIFALTSDTMWIGLAEICEKGVYFTLDGTRSSFQMFVNNEGHVERKPKNIEFIKVFEIHGNEKEITKIK
jgi:hypothetical protein